MRFLMFCDWVTCWNLYCSIVYDADRLGGIQQWFWGPEFGWIHHVCPVSWVWMFFPLVTSALRRSGETRTRRPGRDQNNTTQLSAALPITNSEMSEISRMWSRYFEPVALSVLISWGFLCFHSAWILTGMGSCDRVASHWCNNCVSRQHETTK